MKTIALWTIVFVTPLLWTTTAHALLGIPDVAALAQRVTIIANQGIQIAHSVTQIAKWQEHLTQLTDQYEQIRDQALGSINAIHESFDALTAVKGELTGVATAWRHEFSTERAQDLLTAFDLYAVGTSGGSPLTDHWRGRLANAPRVTEQQMLDAYTDLPASLAELPAQPGGVGTTDGQQLYRGGRRRADARDLALRAGQLRLSAHRHRHRRDLAGAGPGGQRHHER